MDICRLQRAITASWRDDTRQPPYFGDHAAAGQCCVSALVVQHFLGGTIVRGITNKGGVHYWNELEGGAWYDPTRAQFGSDEHVVESDRNPPHHLYLFRETIEKYELLLGRVRERLAADAEAEADRHAPSATTGDSMTFLISAPSTRPHRDAAGCEAIQVTATGAPSDPQLPGGEACLHT